MKLWTARPPLPETPNAVVGVGWAAIGWSNHLGWYEGFRVLTAVNPQGVITGCSFASASTKDQNLAEDFFACRHEPHGRLPTVGQPSGGYYVVDKGFAGKNGHAQWYLCYGVKVVCPPKVNSKHPWPKRRRRWLAGIRQIVERVYEKLQHTFRLERERPHTQAGLQARLAAKVALHNFCIWLNGQLRRPLLAFADLLDW